MSDAYVKDVLVLDSSLKQHRTARRMGLLTTPQVSESMGQVVEAVFDEVIMLDVLDSGNSAHLTLMKRCHTEKPHSWSLMESSKCVLMGEILWFS